MATLPNAIVYANQKGEENRRFGKTTLSHRTCKSLDPNRPEYDRLFKHIKKQRRRIRKLSLIIRGPETNANAKLYAITRAKILRYNIIINNCLMKMKQRDTEQNRLHAREVKRVGNKEAIENLEKVRLERSKMVDYVPEEVKEPKEKTIPDKTLTYFVESKSSTKKKPRYDEMTGKEYEKAFFARVNKPEPKPREKKVTEPFPYMRRKLKIAETQRLQAEAKLTATA